MPCDTSSTTELDAGKFNIALLMETLTALNLSPRQQGTRVSFQGGEYNADTAQFTFNDQYGNAGTRGQQIRQAYSGQVLKTQAKRYGWTLKETAPNQYVIAKR